MTDERLEQIRRMLDSGEGFAAYPEPRELLAYLDALKIMNQRQVRMVERAEDAEDKAKAERDEAEAMVESQRVNMLCLFNERDEARRKLAVAYERALKFELAAYHLADVAASHERNLREARVNLRELHADLDEACKWMKSAGLCARCGGAVGAFCLAGHWRCECDPDA